MVIPLGLNSNDTVQLHTEQLITNIDIRKVSLLINKCNKIR